MLDLGVGKGSFPYYPGTQSLLQEKNSLMEIATECSKRVHNGTDRRVKAQSEMKEGGRLYRTSGKTFQSKCSSSALEQKFKGELVRWAKWVERREQPKQRPGGTK